MLAFLGAGGFVLRPKKIPVLLVAGWQEVGMGAGVESYFNFYFTTVYKKKTNLHTE